MWTSTKGMVGDRILYNGEYCGRIVSIHIDEDANPIEEDDFISTGTNIRYVIKLSEQYKDLKYPYITLDEDELNCGGLYTIDMEE